MRIEPSGVQPQQVRAQAGSQTRAADKPTDSAAAPAAAPAGGYAPTGELARLLGATKQSPDVRPDVVASVSARLAAGEFDTPGAAADTARAMLDPNG
ncbi:MAG TPA: hypothetical protein VH092_08155 [Urbifossiella sp.]|jgi:hypothetical protein|nr:hypothetical protein [Urbifossiella sp.]